MPEGDDRWGHCLLGNHIVDHMEALSATCTKKGYCTGCSAKPGELHRVHDYFERKTTGKMKTMYHFLLERQALVNAKGFIVNQAAMTRAEFELCNTRLIKNAFWEFRFFCVYTQTLPDPLHLADLGLFQAIIFAIFDDWKSTLFSRLPQWEIRWKRVINCLGGRLQNCRLLDQEGFSDYIQRLGTLFTIADANGGNSAPIFTGKEYRRLMAVRASFMHITYQIKICSVSCWPPGHCKIGITSDEDWVLADFATCTCQSASR